MSTPKPPAVTRPGATRALRVTAAAFAVGVALSTPAMASADSGQADTSNQAGRAEKPAQVNRTGNDSTAADPARTPRRAPAPEGQVRARVAAERSTPSRAPAAANRSGPMASALRQPIRQSPARTGAPVADAAPPQAPVAAAFSTADSTTTVDATTDLGMGPGTDQAAAPRALAVAAAPTAAATGTADVFSGLLAPIQSFFEGIALLIRRTFFNQAPTVAPVQTTGQLTGPITGSIGAVDPEGDPLTYEVTIDPRHGTVTLGSDGDYLYTPGPDFTGLDSFTVAVTDTGFHINLLDLSRPASTEAFLQVAQNATLPMLTFSFVYGRGSQFWSAEARGALQDAAMLLATYVVVDSPVTIVYDVTGESSPSSSTLASAGSDLADPGVGFIATVVQQKVQSGRDANGKAADGEITWNFGNPWAFGAQVGTDEYDFISTAMHELLHTFGFLSYTLEPGSNSDRYWTTFDEFVVTADGTRVISDTYRWRSAYDTNLTGGSGGLYFGGANAVAIYGGPVPLYTPDPWESGSSMSHLDDVTFTGADTMLMNAETDTGLGIRVVSPLELAILKDLGYTVTEPAPLQALILLGLGFLRRRPQRPVSWSIRL